MNSSKEPRNSGRGEGAHLPDHDGERDFADFLAGSRRADHESTLPLPEEQGRSRRTADNQSMQSSIDSRQATIDEYNKLL